MSFLAKLFGGKGGSSKTPTAAEAIQRLREIEEMLIKKQDFLETKVNSELQIAKKNGTKNKRAALQALKRKKRYEKQLQQIDGTLTTIEYQREALENANTNTEVLKVMGYAAKALKGAHDISSLRLGLPRQEEVQIPRKTGGPGVQHDFSCPFPHKHTRDGGVQKPNKKSRWQQSANDWKLRYSW